jgi:Predicted 3'-5' exonuclease related to the exonuclease domain of PolB
VPGAKVKLDDVSKILGLGGKPEGIDGSRVEEMILSGQIEEVSRYCESDVMNTYRVWLVHELFRGAITAEELDWSERQIREFVQARKTANPHLNAALAIRYVNKQRQPLAKGKFTSSEHAWPTGMTLCCVMVGWLPSLLPKKPNRLPTHTRRKARDVDGFSWFPVRVQL